MASSDTNKRRRLPLGAAIFVLGQLSPLVTIPLLGYLSLPEELEVLLSSILFIAVPPLFTMVSVALVGKDGFNELKRLAVGWLKTIVFAEKVGRTRYRIGLVLFVIPFLTAWIDPYLNLLVATTLETSRVALAGDVMLLVSLLVLGGDFWQKFRALFLWQSAVDPV